MKLLVFGNPYIEQDNLALKLVKYLKKNKNFEIKLIENTFQLVEQDLDDSILLDVVKGLDKVQFLSVEQLSSSSITTGHDFDIAFFLKLIEKKPRIIGIPQSYDEAKALKEMRELLE